MLELVLVFILGPLFCFIIAWIIIKINEYRIDKRYSAVANALVERYDFCVSHNKDYSKVFEENNYVF